MIVDYSDDCIEDPDVFIVAAIIVWIKRLGEGDSVGSRTGDVELHHILDQIEEGIKEVFARDELAAGDDEELSVCAAIVLEKSGHGILQPRVYKVLIGGRGKFIKSVREEYQVVKRGMEYNGCGEE